MKTGNEMSRWLDVMNTSNTVGDKGLNPLRESTPTPTPTPTLEQAMTSYAAAYVRDNIEWQREMHPNHPLDDLETFEDHVRTTFDQPGGTFDQLLELLKEEYQNHGDTNK